VNVVNVFWVGLDSGLKCFCALLLFSGLPPGQEPKGKWFCPGCAAQRKRSKGGK
jgi:hypothetical protein